MTRKMRTLERALAEHYRGERRRMGDEACEGGKAFSPPEPFLNAVGAAAREAERPGGRDRRMRAALAGFLLFACDQARFIPKSVWSLQLAAVLCAVAMCAFDARGSFACCVVSALGAALAGCGMPAVAASKACGMAELEYACPFDCRAVAAARMLAVGCASAFFIAFISLLVPAVADTGALSTLVHACAPFFVSCAVGMLLARRMSGASAGAGPVIAACVLACACAVLALAVPQAYTPAALGIWSAAAAAALLWTAREAHELLADIAAGLDEFAAAKDGRYGKGRDISWS